MHLGTSTILLAFSLFGNLCGAQKPPNPPPESSPGSSPERDEKIRVHFTRSHEDFVDKFAEPMANVEMLETKYQDQDKALTAEARQTATYGVIVKQHEKLVARGEALKAERDAHVAYFEEHKQAPDGDELTKLVRGESDTESEARKLATEYRELNSRVEKLVRTNER